MALTKTLNPKTGKYEYDNKQPPSLEMRVIALEALVAQLMKTLNLSTFYSSNE